MKKSLKIVSILMMAIMMAMVATPVFAVGAEIIDDIEVKAPDNTGKAMEFVGRMMGFIQWGAIIGGTVIIAILGIKYMMGSLEEKAEYKKSMIPLVVGIVVVMGAATIAKLLFNAFAL